MIELLSTQVGHYVAIQCLLDSNCQYHESMDCPLPLFKDGTG